MSFVVHMDDNNILTIYAFDSWSRDVLFECIA